MDYQKNRATSAGYRFPLSKSRPRSSRSSDFHQTCVPAERRAAAVQASDSPHKDGEYVKCDAVTQDKIWKQAVGGEKRSVKQWEDNWGFLTEFDDKGRPKSAKELPTEVNMFSDTVPNTNAGNYGSQLGSEVGRTMQRLEFNFNSHNRRKKLGKDLVCY